MFLDRCDTLKDSVFVSEKIEIDHLFLSPYTTLMMRIAPLQQRFVAKNRAASKQKQKRATLLQNYAVRVLFLTENFNDMNVIKADLSFFKQFSLLSRRISCMLLFLLLLPFILW